MFIISFIHNLSKISISLKSEKYVYMSLEKRGGEGVFSHSRTSSEVQEKEGHGKEREMSGTRMTNFLRIFPEFSDIF